MELEESAKAAIQSNSGAEPEDHYSARIYRLCAGFARYAWKYRGDHVGRGQVCKEVTLESEEVHVLIQP